jgi:hypothetical protein
MFTSKPLTAMNSRFSDHQCQIVAYLVLIVLAILLTMIPSHSAAAAESKRKVVEWTFPTSESSAEIESKLHTLENEIISRYQWQVEWQGSDLDIQGKLFDAILQYAEGSVSVRMEMEPTLYVLKRLVRSAFESELRKHLQLL